MIQIDPDINIAELANQYPHIVEFLVREYGFHCFGCFVSEFETLSEGAMVHDIVGEDFDAMMEIINKLANDETQKSSSTS
jgi:hybrid cluster-associated redox disulfide protein